MTAEAKERKPRKDRGGTHRCPRVVGRRFANWKVMEELERDRSGPYPVRMVVARCDCGNEETRALGTLRGAARRGATSCRACRAQPAPTRERAREMASKGLNRTEIARELGVSRQRIQQVLSDAGSG